MTGRQATFRPLLLLSRTYSLIVGLGSSHGWAYCVMFSGRHSLSTQVYKWGLTTLMGEWGEDRNWYIIPLIGGPNYLKQLDLCTFINNTLYIFSLPTRTLFIFSTLLSPNPLHLMIMVLLIMVNVKHSADKLPDAQPQRNFSPRFGFPQTTCVQLLTKC